MKIRFQLSLSLDDARTNFNLSKDSVYVCGSSKTLGSWDLRKATELKSKLVDTYHENNCSLSLSSLSLSSSSSSEIYVPDNLANSNVLELEALVDFEETFQQLVDEQVQYKYFIAQKMSNQKDTRVFLKQVEYNPRQLELANSNLLSHEVIDKWPLFDQENRQSRIDHGWLLSGENEFRFHFFNNPLQLWHVDSKNLCYDITPWKANYGLHELKDFNTYSADFDEHQIVNDKRTKFNAFNLPNVYSSYRIRTHEIPSDLLFQINVYELDEYGKPSDKYLATGYFKVNRLLLESSIMEVDVSLLNSNQIVGSLKTEILLITSLNEESNYMIRKSYNYHFNRSCIPIGHRGMGKTFDAGSLPGTEYVENTIESFREAYNRGAQMVEFDVVLTKDNIPIVYHDFTFCIDQLTDKNSNKYLSIGVNQLTYEEVKQNKIYSQKILKKALLSEDLRDFFTSKLMFPTLREMCTQLDPKLGFNVEIKYPIDLEDGSHELGNHLKWLNRNEYVDLIIKELYELCEDDQRCVIISTFDPNLCSMIKMKQSKFPVLFLTNGVTSKWVPYKDARCKNTQRSFNFARAESLHGLVAHAEELTKNMHIINLLFSHTSKTANFLAYSWGDDLNDLDKRQLLSQAGLHGIIYDRINESL